MLMGIHADMLYKFPVISNLNLKGAWIPRPTLQLVKGKGHLSYQQRNLAKCNSLNAKYTSEISFPLSKVSRLVIS